MAERDYAGLVALATQMADPGVLAARYLAPNLTGLLTGEPPPPIANVPEHGKVPSTADPRTFGAGYEAMELLDYLSGGKAAMAGAAASMLPRIRAPKPPVQLGDYPGLVSTRFPVEGPRTKPLEDPLQTYLQPNMAAFRALDPGRHEQMLRTIAAYPGMPDKLAAAKDVKEIEGVIGKFMRDNLRSVYDAQPDIVKDLAQRWYVGAGDYIGNVARTANLPKTSAVGVYAALSPNYHWFKNVSAGDRIIDAMSKHQGMKTSDDMIDAARNIDSITKPMIDRIRNKKLGELGPEDQATWIRLFDEAESIKDPSRRSMRQIAPTGEIGPVWRTQEGKGEPQRFSWPYPNSIEQAIRSLRSGGDLPTIRAALGERHKVPSFYNNLLFPRAPSGDVTADTQHIAAALFRPLSGEHPIVALGLGGGPKSQFTGISGAYPLYVTPTQQVAKRLDLDPRALQSVDWEGIRGLFNPAAKRALGPRTESIWKDVTAGNIPPAVARQQIIDLVKGGYQLPDWVQWATR